MKRQRSRRSIKILLLLALLCGCAAKEAPFDPETIAPVVIENAAELRTQKKDLSGYEGITDDAVFETVTLKESLRLFSEGTSGLLFCTQTDCLWCQLAVPVLQEACERTQTKVWTVDTAAKIRPEDYDTLKGYIEEILPEDEETGEKVFYIPVLLAVKDGQIKAYHISLTDDFRSEEAEELTPEQHLELLRIYAETIASLGETEDDQPS